MKKTLLIIGSVALVCLLLIIRLFFRQGNRLEEEREWFARALHYEFSAKVDSIRMLNEHTGKLWCRVLDGHPNAEREDSLKLHFKQHDMLYLIFHQSADSIVFLVPYGNLLITGDSVHISSEHKTIQFYREGKEVANEELSETLTGFAKPFFLKGK